MSITDKLNDLKIAKQDIKSAIQEKGVTPTGGLSTYADAIRDIQTGGGGGTVALPIGTKFGGSTFTGAPLFDTSEYTDMSQMFLDCSNLEVVPEYDTSNVTSMSFMFQGCHNLETIPQFDTSNVDYMTSMFRDCTNLATIPQLDTSNVIFMADMFRNCKKLETIPQLDTRYVYNISSMFWNCQNLTNVGGFKDLKVGTLDLHYSPLLTYESLSNIIYNLKFLTDIDTNPNAIVLHPNAAAKLTDDLINIATDKGWTISTATPS